LSLVSVECGLFDDVDIDIPNFRNTSLTQMKTVDNNAKAIIPEPGLGIMMPRKMVAIQIRNVIFQRIRLFIKQTLSVNFY